ncbi:hypothetical protein BU24DRAFT_120328 [Aaosphaeria arxii CBS 175.79]|uniref:Uncharacterized protein n=1 Tax=Aaosphaeria arxii CBS 175.79 TaxID=1450172 RepID=A0A6A5Y317_9PLEO|nr:uncharacterized protein BU24DRAFT_120328 [Aaosphaeria arxii CBS 175.79]KAF2019437.1 hypothetical protein BU24DRAFT_120328 [Aaosphaeria arxii CBS 175.79]
MEITVVMKDSHTNMPLDLAPTTLYCPALVGGLLFLIRKTGGRICLYGDAVGLGALVYGHDDGCSLRDNVK